MNLKHYEIVIYKDYLKVDIQKTLKEYKTIKKWAYILHDKDDTDPHYHIYVNFGGQSVDSALVAKWFKLAYTDEKGVEHSGENFIEKVKGRLSDVLLYLIHGNDTQQYKHQYSPTEVVANFDFSAEITNGKIIGNFKEYSYAQQLEYVYSLPRTEKTKAFADLEKHWKLHCRHLSLITDRDISVIFVSGAGGTGKTYYAKKFLNKMKLDFCVSSSSNDPFQDYLGQKAIILDDLRDTAFSLADLLKLLDNNTASSVKSRFENKVFNGEFIVITSSVPLTYWYQDYKSGSYDDLKQLYRRISCYVVVTKDEVSVFNEVGTDGKPKGVAQVFKNELADMPKQEKVKRDFGALFSQICEPATSDVFDVQQTEMFPRRPIRQH